VDAQLLVTALLDAGEDPKDFLRNVAPREFPPLDEVEFNMDVQWEGDLDPEDQFDNPEDVAWVRQQIRADNVWGWCRVAMRASWRDPNTDKEYEGWDYLGACSYENEASFKQPGGYYDDMKQQAYDELQAEVAKARQAGE
jgi:hypothetical protein